MAKHNLLGKQGEEIALDYLIAKGFIIMEVNYYYDRAEVDIIAYDKNQLVIVEVKTRNSSFFGDPQSFVTPKKIKQLLKVANYYIEMNEIDVETRFDIVAVLINKKEKSIDHYVNAFYHF